MVWRHRLACHPFWYKSRRRSSWIRTNRWEIWRNRSGDCCSWRHSGHRVSWSRRPMCSPLLLGPFELFDRWWWRSWCIWARWSGRLGMRSSCTWQSERWSWRERICDRSSWDREWRTSSRLARSCDDTNAKRWAFVCGLRWKKCLRARQTCFLYGHKFNKKSC